MIVLGIDPGKTTGWCIVRWRGDTFFDTLSYGEYIMKEDKGLEGIYRLYEQIIDNYEPELVVLEDFVKHGAINKEKITQITSAVFAELVTKMNLIDWYVIQPEQRKIADKIPLDNLYPVVPTTNHARDAYRIAIAGSLLRNKN